MVDFPFLVVRLLVSRPDYRVQCTIRNKRMSDETDSTIEGRGKHQPLG